MPQLVSVRFRYNPKPLWFDPQGKSYEVGTEVLVETERGREVGIVIDPAINATDKEISKLKSPLKPVIRELSDLDYEHVDALDEKGAQAMPYFREKIEEYELDIKPVEVQYLFSGERAIFYFSSEERVDFRDLVRDLAQHFHVRIDMRQIGARDEAKELGGLAHCGEEFCCTRFGGEFQPVSIRMAKEQDLPLNPTKISGACGRLMCCLRYEYEAYKDFKKRAPKKGTVVETPLGDAVISGYNTPSETMELKLEDGKRLNVPLAEMETEKGKDGCSRCSVNRETIERCATRSMLIALGSLEQQLEDSLASDAEVTDMDLAIDTGGGERKRRRRSSQKSEDAATERPAGRQSSSRRSTTKHSSSRHSDSSSGASPDSGRSSDEKSSQGTRRRRRRGNASGGTVGTGGRADSTGGNSGKQDTSAQKQQQRSQGRPQGKATSGSSDASQARTERRRADQGGSGEKTREKPRPGQRSSGLRKPRNRTASKEQPLQNSSQGASQSSSFNTSRGASQDGSQGRTPGTLTSGSPSAESSQGDTRRRRRRHESGNTASGSGGNTDSGDAGSSSGKDRAGGQDA